MEFKVIDGTSPLLTEIEFKSFREDYLTSDMTTNDVRLKYGLSKKQYSDITKKIREEEGIDCRPYSRAKHFYKHNGRWYVIKTTKKERIYFGSLPCIDFSKQDMEQIVKKMAKMRWEYTRCKEFLQCLRNNPHLN